MPKHRRRSAWIWFVLAGALFACAAVVVLVTRNAEPVRTPPVFRMSQAPAVQPQPAPAPAPAQAAAQPEPSRALPVAPQRVTKRLAKPSPTGRPRSVDAAPASAEQESAEDPNAEDEDAAEEQVDAEESDESTAAAEEDATSTDALTAQVLLQRYRSKRDEDAVRRDDEVKVRDVVTKVGRTEISFGKVKCSFDEPPENVKAGDTVSVEGTVTGRSFWTRTLTLKPCRLAD